MVVSVMPSQHCRRLFEQMRPHLRPEIVIVSATKGLEENSLLRMTEVIAQVVDNSGIASSRVGALSGPSFALRGGSWRTHCGRHRFNGRGAGGYGAAGVQQFQLSAFIRTMIYRGVELGGALKNTVRDRRGHLRGA
jgi:glycerol-3-phosphate dehydrogenase (NAD(P)+)